MRENDFALSGQVLAEFVSVVRRKSRPPLTEDEIDGWLTQLSAREVAPVDAELVRNGAAISRRFRIADYDGAILAAAERLGCEAVVTEDLNDGQVYGRARAHDPFRGL